MSAFDCFFVNSRVQNMSDFYGGDGYDSNAGGYDANASPSNGSPGGERKAGDRSEQNLLPVTINQINSADEEGNTFTIDGKAVYQISFVAAIRDTTENSTNISFVLEDGTGEIVAKLFVDESESDSAAMQRAQWKYVVKLGILGVVCFRSGRPFHAKTVVVVDDALQSGQVRPGHRHDSCTQRPPKRRGLQHPISD